MSSGGAFQHVANSEIYDVNKKKSGNVLTGNPSGQPIFGSYNNL